MDCVFDNMFGAVVKRLAAMLARRWQLVPWLVSFNDRYSYVTLNFPNKNITWNSYECNLERTFIFTLFCHKASYQKILYFLVIIIHLCMKTDYAWHNALFINQIGYWRMFWIPIVSTTKSGGCSSIRRTKQRLKKLIYICEDSFFHLYERIYWKINCNEKFVDAYGATMLRRSYDIPS